MSAEWEKLRTLARMNGYYHGEVDDPPTIWLSAEKGLVLVQRGPNIAAGWHISCSGNLWMLTAPSAELAIDTVLQQFGHPKPRERDDKSFFIHQMYGFNALRVKAWTTPTSVRYFADSAVVGCRVRHEWR